jgi:hypothetical protein
LNPIDEGIPGFYIDTGSLVIDAHLRASSCLLWMPALNHSGGAFAKRFLSGKFSF